MPPENAGVVVYQIANGVTSLEDSPENLAYKLTAIVDESDLAFVAWLVTQPRETDRRSDEENPHQKCSHGLQLSIQRQRRSRITSLLTRITEHCLFLPNLTGNHLSHP